MKSSGYADIRKQIRGIQKSVAAHRRDIAAFKRQQAAQERVLKAVSKNVEKTVPTPSAAMAEENTLRFRADSFRSLRKKLGISANEMAKLLGVSGQSSAVLRPPRFGNCNMRRRVDTRRRAIGRTKSGAENSPAFLEILHKGGWLSPVEQLAADRAQSDKIDADARMARAKEEADRLRIERDLPLLKTRGTRICREEQQCTLIAFVEDATDRKIQYRIADLVLTRNPSSNLRPSGFNPGQIEWDFPNGGESASEVTSPDEMVVL